MYRIILELSKFRYKIIGDNIEDLSPLKTQKFYVSANFSGITSLLIFVTLKGKKYAFTADRRTLSYSLKKIGEFVGGRDHTTIIHSIREYKNRYQNEEHYRMIVNNVYNKIGLTK